RIREPQDKPYNAGDKVVCTVSVTKELGYDTGVCDVYVGEMHIGSIEELAEGEVAELEYTYTVTESDLERGYFENTVQVFFFDDDEFCYEFELLDAFSNTSVRAEVSEPDSESESEPDNESESEPDSESESEPHADPDGTEDEKSPETGDESEIFIVIAAGAVLCMMLLKKRSPQLQDQA
ncbi:MAG: hypothetical protein IKR27_06030, partial [Lachnospiraceae bacterium]|nr:hypothetical protein [Lachnospiraceae bacterium]